MVYNEDRGVINSIEAAQNVVAECIRASVVALPDKQ